MAWSASFSDNFTRANAASWGNGWVDAGSVGSIVSNTGLYTGVASGTPWTNKNILRPTSENLLNQRVVARITGPSTFTGVYVVMRHTTSGSGGSTSTGVCVGVDYGDNTLKISNYTGSSANTNQSIATTGALNPAHVYELDCQAVGTSPTVITATLKNINTGVTVATATWNESGAAFQVAGQTGTFSYNGSATPIISYSIWTNYTDAALTAGTATLISTGNTIASVAVTAATGGASPYTYQWYRSTTSGFTPGGGNIVSGATSLTLNDTGLTNGTTYYYKNVATDSASGTVTSNQISATPSASLTAGTASTTSVGSTIASVAVTAATGGISPYTYQWYRSTTSGFTPGGGNIVSGATSLTLNDTGLTNGTTYYYKNVATDSAAGTVTSNQTSATPFSSITIPVNSTAFICSPGNWKGDTGRGGSTYRRAWNVGAYMRIRINAASSGATATLLMPTSGTAVTLAYFINGKLIAKNQPCTGNLTLTGLVAGAINDIFVVLDKMVGTDRWNGANQLQINGLTIDGNSSAGVAPVFNKWVMFVGDSITEGVQADAGTESNLYCYSFLAGQAFLANGYDYCVSAADATGYIVANSGIPAYYDVVSGVYSPSTSRWNLIDAGVSILDSNGQISAYGNTNTAPDLIINNDGGNDCNTSANLAYLQTSVTGWNDALKTAAPLAKVLTLIPFNLYNTALYASGPTYINAIKAGLAGSTNANSSLADLTVTLSSRLASSGYSAPDGIHPYLPGHANITPLVLWKMTNALVVGSVASGFVG